MNPLLSALLLSGTLLGAAELRPPAETPVAGQPSSLQFVEDGVPVAGLEVEARYRTNAHASLQHTQELGVTDSEGRVVWTPDQPGVIELAWDGSSATIAVRHDGWPASGVLVAILAGLLLIGGSTLFFRKMLNEPHTTPEAETHRVDT